jgi:hypothetical protein
VLFFSANGAVHTSPGLRPIHYGFLWKYKRFFFTDNILNVVLLHKGQIVDASIVRAPKQWNSREENQVIEYGGKPEGWRKNKQRQKDMKCVERIPPTDRGSGMRKSRGGRKQRPFM